LLHDPLAVRKRAEVVERLADFVHTEPSSKKGPVISGIAQTKAVEERS
jgi:hypothetical protein